MFRMKYTRLTKMSEMGTLHALDINGEEQPLCELTTLDTDILIGRLYELENKIESGELCDREEARKETAKDILKWLKFLYAERQKEYANWDGNKIHAVTTKWLNADIECIAKEYGIELFGKTEQVGNSDKLEDEKWQSRN